MQRQRIRTIALAGVLAAAFAWAVSSASVAETAPTPQAVAGQPASTRAGTLTEVTVPARALEGNLLGDPPFSRVAVYLPPSYKSSPARRYPSLYLLHGFTGDIDAFTKGYQGMQLARTMDELIERGVVREMVVIVPSGNNGYQGSFYRNSTTTGRWEDFFAKDLVAWVDGNYRTVNDAGSRGVAGHSMGGYGAIMLGMLHPDVFGAVYALSPCCTALVADLSADNPAWRQALRVKSRDELKGPPKSFDDFFVRAFYGFAAAVSPSPGNSPLFADLPFKAEGSRIVPNEDAYGRWRASMPVYLVEQHRTNLLKLRGIFLDYGAHEEFSHIRLGARALSEELANRSIPHVFEIYPDGDHISHIRQRIETRVLPFFSQRLAGQ
jgi:S-formylglutathione hydrolase FrmB